MAIWQFDIALVPETALAADPDLFVHSVTPEGVETAAWWSSISVPSDLESRLGEILPKGDSWSDELSVWGTDDGHRIDLWLIGDAIESLAVRIDAREDASDFVKAVCAFAQSMQCRFYGYESRAEIEPTTAALHAAIQVSDATKFARDPRGFLTEVAEKGGS